MRDSFSAPLVRPYAAVMRHREDWTVTTHAWTADVDVAHLEDVRAAAPVHAAGGLTHLVLEVLAYAAEEAEAQGRTGRARVVRHADGSVSVADDGRGTDTRVDASGAPVRKPVMATRDVRFFDRADAPLLADGLPRAGMSTVAALSEVLDHTNRRLEGAWTQRYVHGVPASALDGVAPDGTTGTTVRFRPDAALVADLDLDVTLLAVVAGLDVEVVDAR